MDPEWNIKVSSACTRTIERCAHLLLLIQITIISLGAFDTNAIGAMPKLPVHSAYDKPNLLVAQSRKSLLASLTGNLDPMYEIKGDASKAADAIYRMSLLPSPPVRVPLGCVDLARDAIKSFSEEVEEYASWSVGLDKD